MRQLLTPAWLVRHGLVALVLPAFGWLAWWQYHRAVGGNTLSWAYTFQWPVFAGFVVFLWWREVRIALRGLPGAIPGSDGGADAAAGREPVRADGYRAPVLTMRRTAAAAGAPDGGGDLRGDAAHVAYNQYLAWLAAHPHARPADYPG